MTDAIGQGTGEGLLAFLDWTMDKNELNRNTAGGLKTGVRNVMSVDEDPANVNLRDLDVDQYLIRFTNKSRGKYADKSVEVYRQRFKQAVTMYLAWLDGGDWRPARLRPTTNGTSSKVTKSMPRDQRSPSHEGSLPSQPTAASLIEYPFPLRPGVRARLMLPEDLTAREAERIGAFINALAIAERLAITSGHSDEQ